MDTFLYIIVGMFLIWFIGSTIEMVNNEGIGVLLGVILVLGFSLTISYYVGKLAFYLWGVYI
jgi:hypothetical protein